MTIIFALDLGTATGRAVKTADGQIVSGAHSFRPGRFDGGGMRFLRFRGWLAELQAMPGSFGAVYFEEVRRHLGVDAAHAYGGFMATLAARRERFEIPYSGVPVGSIKRHAAGKGIADKAEMVAGMQKLGHSLGDDNEADALALLNWVLNQHKSATQSSIGAHG